MAKENDFSKVSDIIQKIREQYNQEKINSEEKFFSDWQSIAGEKLAKYSEPQRLTEDGILLVNCKNSVIANEIFRAKDTINQKLRTAAQNAGVNGFKYIKITYG